MTAADYLCERLLEWGVDAVEKQLAKTHGRGAPEGFREMVYELIPGL